MMHSPDIQNCLLAILPQVNWKRAFAEQWEIQISTTQNIDDINALFVPWYRTENEFDVDYRTPNAQPVNVEFIKTNLAKWGQKRRNDICKYAADFSRANGCELTIPLYPLPNGTNLILDGNHRCVALSLAKVPFFAKFVRVMGPPEANALPDLIHWT